MSYVSLIFATNNDHKLEEVKALLSQKINILSLKDIGFDKDIPETGITFEENALIKTTTIKAFSSLDCFSDDSGLEVKSLNNEPGVYSARYAGENASDKENVIKLLQSMKGVESRKARFKTVVCLNWNQQIYYFEGVVEGLIAQEPKGLKGFGYDPIFIPNGYQNTFAELGAEVKNKISHRSIAIQQLVNFVNENV
jgi:XTP/dITP diphosphohydrolase